jgi:hypothetical protein
MAKKKPPLVTDKTFFYSDLNFFDPAYKNVLWCAQSVFYGKLNYINFLGRDRCREYRALEKLEIDESVYKQILDPKTPQGKGGTAEYIASDWKANPIHLHLRNIIRAKMNKVGMENEIQVNEIDKYAKSQKQKDKDKVIWQREFRNLINSVNQDIGLPAIKDSQSPYNYVKSLSSNDGKGNAVDSVDNLLDYIRNQIKDSQDLALYETYVYKGDLERSFEMGIKHYLINLNKWGVISQSFDDDVVNFNRACGRWYTDETTGRGIVEYLNPEILRTDKFSSYNGDDIQGWQYEKDITFAEFVRQFGTTLTNEELKEVFELNKYQGAQHNMSWGKADSMRGSNARIRIGQMSVLTQDAENFAVKDTQGDVKMMAPKKLSWLPDEKESKEGIQAQQKMYNVWYSFYYIPPPSDKVQNNSPADWAWQSKFIFNLKKDIDMYRYGVDMRYARSTLVIWKDDRPSFTDIEQAYMPKIHSAWHKFQNCLFNDVSAVLLAEEFLGSALQAVDESNKDGKGTGVQATLQMMRQIKQGSMAFAKMTDKQGNPLPFDPSKFVIPIKNGLLEEAEKYLKIIMDLYTMMMMALAQNDLTQAQGAKPRTPVAGVQAALASSQEGIWFIEKACREILIAFGERTVQHILCMIKERKRYQYKKRFDEFASVIGNANIWMLEGIEDIDPEEIGLTVTLENVDANKQMVVEMAMKMAAEDKVSYDAVGLVVGVVSVNWKYAYTLLMVAVKAKERENAHKEELQHERAMEEKDADLKVAMALQKGKADGKDQNQMTQGKIQAMLDEQLNKLKSETLAQSKEQLLQNKLKQEQQKHELQRQDATSDALSPEK